MDDHGPRVEVVEPVQPEQTQGVQYVSPTTGEPVQTVAATPQEATPLPQTPPAQAQATQVAQQKLTQAQAALPAAVQSKNTPKIFSALDEINKASNELATAESPAPKVPGLELFDPANAKRTRVLTRGTFWIWRDAIHWREHVIWGMTEVILRTFQRVAL